MLSSWQDRHILENRISYPTVEPRIVSPLLTDWSRAEPATPHRILRAENVLHRVLSANSARFPSRADHGAGQDGAEPPAGQAAAGVPHAHDPRRGYADALEHVHHCQIGELQIGSVGNSNI